MNPSHPLPPPRAAANGETCHLCGRSVTVDTARRIPLPRGSWRTEHHPRLQCRTAPTAPYEQRRAHTRQPSSQGPAPEPDESASEKRLYGSSRIIAQGRCGRIWVEEVEILTSTGNTARWFLYGPGLPSGQPYSNPAQALDALYRWSGKQPAPPGPGA